MITPDDIGDHLFKRRKERQMPEEELDLYLMELDRQEQNREIDEAWEEYLRREQEKEEVSRQVKATMKIVDSILDWLRGERKAA